MAYEVIRTVKGRQYRYLQESYREGKRVRTRSKYLGPLIEAVRNAAMVAKPWQEKPEDEARRVARETAAYAKRDHVNGLLSGESITLDQMKEVVDVQCSGELNIIPGGVRRGPNPDNPAPGPVAQKEASPSEGEAEGSKDRDAGDALGMAEGDKDL